MQSKESLARDILNSLTISGAIRNIYIDNVASPWSEKVERLKAKKGNVDVKLTLWDSDTFLYGRIYRLFLYVHDALDSSFTYNRDLIPHGTSEPKTRELYNHIWGIYVDSRIERLGIDSFFNKILRRNLFIDSQKNLPWTISNLVFAKLWDKATYTHSEIIDYAYNLERLSEGDRTVGLDAFEIEIGRSLMDHTAREYVDNIASNDLRGIALAIYNFVTGHCRGTLIESSYYGIYFMYDQEIFVEMVASKADTLLVTLFDYESNANKTYTITKDTVSINSIQIEIKTIYDRIANHSRLKIVKNPYAVSFEK
ncbi:MAG: hypothetical protein C0392_13810 [Syntrophus sp. (in: bacteria)]|nr:hypothetical protein [Syntrophus sp. (in: bacteria)]